jgi:hypothetical protein
MGVNILASCTSPLMWLALLVSSWELAQFEALLEYSSTNQNPKILVSM